MVFNFSDYYMYDVYLNCYEIWTTRNYINWKMFM